MLQTFFNGRKDKTFVHKKLLYQFLDKHFAHRQNDHHPLFIRSEMQVDDKKQNRISFSTWPCIITSYDANHITPIGAALFDEAKQICDMHDGKISDVKALNTVQTIASVEQFCDIPPVPRSVKDILTYPEPFRKLWMDSVIKELHGIVNIRNGITPCTKEFMYTYLKEHPKSYALLFLPVFKIKLDNTFKTRFKLD